MSVNRELLLSYNFGVRPLSVGKGEARDAPQIGAKYVHTSQRVSGLTVWQPAAGQVEQQPRPFQ